MKKLNVIFYREKKEKFPVGQLAESRNRIYFEYDPAFLAAPLWLSPFKLPPNPGLHEHKDRNFGQLFGLFDDSLPDGWGVSLMDRFFRKHSMTFLGEGRSPGKNEIMQLGKRAGLTTIEINRCLDQVLQAVKAWPDHARAAGVTKKSTSLIKSVINHNIKTL